MINIILYVFIIQAHFYLISNFLINMKQEQQLEFFKCHNYFLETLSHTIRHASNKFR